MITKPMLAVACKDIATLKFPVLATPKLDGIRCLVINGKAVSRKLKPIPNHHIRTTIECSCPDGFDGEIMIPGADFNTVQSLVMTEDGTPDFAYHVFDYVKGDLTVPYADRVRALVEADFPAFVVPVTPILLGSADQLAEVEEQFVRAGYEGVMVRSPYSPYKCGRSTAKEGYLLKIKQFEDSEAEVLGFEELLINLNERTVNELGQAKRSSHQENLVPSGMLGALIVKDIATGVEFKIGTGMDHALRKEIWENRPAHLGRFVTYRFQPSGMKEKPRFPSFKGFRDPRDMGGE